MTVWYKETDCPVCKTDFKYPRIKSRDIKPKKRDTDFMCYYDGINPLLYQIAVCPQCYYADKYAGFEKITPAKAERVMKDFERRREVAGKIDFTADRTVASAIKSYELAALTGIARRDPSDEVAGCYIRAAWIARSLEKPELENHYLILAYQYYIKAYEQEHTVFGKLGEVGFIYLIGEIARRLKKYDEALKFFSRVISHPQLKKYAEIERLTRDAWQETKALRGQVEETQPTIEEIF